MMNGVCSSANTVIISTVDGSSSDAERDLAAALSADSMVSDGLSPTHDVLSPQNMSPHHNLSDDDDEDMAMSPESLDEDQGSPSFFPSNFADVTAQLVAAGGWQGPVGVAAAAAIASAKKRKKHHCFELNPSIRKRQQTRLLRKLKLTIDEYSTRVGQQAVVLIATPSKSGNNFKCFGAKPLEDVIKSSRGAIMSELDAALALQTPPAPPEDPSLYELPPLVIDGIPTPVEKMTQAQLRAFIPLMLKFSTGRGKPGWGRESTRPAWWPKEVPWANVRMDARSDDQKSKISWTTALRQVVINCYKYHGRDDLLPAFVEDDEKDPNSSTEVTVMTGNNTLSQLTGVTSNNSNGTLDSATSQLFSSPMVQTISNHDGTVSIIQVDPNNPVIQLPDGTTAQVQGIAHVTGDDCDGSGGNHNVQAMALDLNHHTTEATINQDGSIIITGMDGTHIPVSMSGAYGASSLSGVISMPLPLYHTVVANIQATDGQPLQVVTPIMQVPKLEPGCMDSQGTSGLSQVEVATLNGQLEAGTIIAASNNEDDQTTTLQLVTHKQQDGT